LLATFARLPSCVEFKKGFVLYLYLGYLFVHLPPLIIKLFEASVSFSAILFSIVVIFIWSFIPFLGYCLAKLFNAKGVANKYLLFTFGVGIWLIENSLFYFDFLTNSQTIMGTLVAFFLFFIVAFIPVNKSDVYKDQNEK
jgi:hypothetical protein